MAKARGYPCGLSIIEPKGDVAKFGVDLARELGIKAYHLDPTLETSDRINLMKGPVNDVSEATIAVLKGMFGKQEAFFQLVQELTARNFIKLIKLNHGDNLDILSVLRALRDDSILEREQKILERSGKDPDLSSFFANEMQGKLGAKWKDLALGLRAQIENIVSNEDLKRIITGDSGINLDQHMAEGGILAINTALGKLRRSGDAFGQFMSMHLQSAAFRRPGTEKTRVPHYLIIDEMSRYINADTEKFLSIAAEYRVAGIFAVQSFSQLEIGAGDLTPKAMKTAIITNCRNKISFGGITNDDAEYLAKELGKNWVVNRQETFEGSLVASLIPKTYHDVEKEEYRIRPTDIQDGLPRFYYVYKLVQEGRPMKPGIAVGQFIPEDWRQRAKQLGQEVAPQQRGLFSLLQKLLNLKPQPSGEGGSATVPSTKQSNSDTNGSINDHLNLPKESKSKNVIKIKPKFDITESITEETSSMLQDQNKEPAIQQGIKLSAAQQVSTPQKDVSEPHGIHVEKRVENLQEMNQNFM